MKRKIGADKENHRTSRSRVVISWWLSYAIVILLPLVFSMAAYSSMLSAFETETKNANAAVLDIVGREIDTFFSSCDLMFDEVFLDEAIAQVKYVDAENIDSAFRYRLWRIINTRLRNLSVSHTNIMSFYVYMPNSGIMLTNGRYRYAPEAFDLFFQDSGFTWEEFQQYLNEPSVKSIRAVPNKSAKYFLYSSAHTSLGYELKVIVKADEGMIDHIVDGIDWIDKSHYSAFSKDGTLLITNVPDGALNAIPHHDLLRNADAELEMNGERYIVQRATNNRLDYLYLVPRGTLYANMTSSIWAAVLANCVCIIIGTVLSALLIKRNYKPIADIMDQITGGIRHTGNEYEAILSTIIESVGHNRTLTARLAAAQRESGRALLRKYLNGTLSDPSTVRVRLDELGVRLKSERFVAAIFWVSSDVRPDDPEMTHKNKGLMHFAAYSIFEERVSGLSEAYLIDGFEYFSMVAGVDDDHGLQRVMKLLADTKQDALERANLDVVISVSDAVTADDLPGAYHAAVDALRYRMLSDTNIIITPQSGDIVDMRTPVFRAEDKMALLAAIRRDDPSAAEAIVDKFIMQVQVGLPTEAAQFLLFDIIASLIRVVQRLPEQFEQSLLRESDYLRCIMNSTSLTQTAELLHGLIRDICAATSEQRQGSGAELYDKIIFLVRQNLCRAELSNAFIAQTLSMHPSSLSTFFKDRAGIGLAEYINNERVNEAKRLLLDTDLKIKEIAVRVGFTSDLSFIRVFKSRMGVTPGGYRESHRG